MPGVIRRVAPQVWRIIYHREGGGGGKVALICHGYPGNFRYAFPMVFATAVRNISRSKGFWRNPAAPIPEKS